MALIHLHRILRKRSELVFFCCFFLIGPILLWYFDGELWPVLCSIPSFWFCEFCGFCEGGIQRALEIRSINQFKYVPQFCRLVFIFQAKTVYVISISS